MTGPEILPASVWHLTADTAHVFANLEDRRAMAAAAATERSRSRVATRRAKRTHEGKKSS